MMALWWNCLLRSKFVQPVKKDEEHHKFVHPPRCSTSKVTTKSDDRRLQPPPPPPLPTTTTTTKTNAERSHSGYPSRFSPYHRSVLDEKNDFPLDSVADADSADGVARSVRRRPLHQNRRRHPHRRRPHCRRVSLSSTRRFGLQAISPASTSAIRFVFPEFSMHLLPNQRLFARV